MSDNADEIKILEEIPQDLEDVEDIQGLNQLDVEEDSEGEKEQEENNEEKEDIISIQNLQKKHIMERQTSSSVREEGDTEQNDSEFIEALKKYYRFKSEYDDSLKVEKKKIMSMEGLSIKDKRNEFLKLKKKCVNCKRPVGTIFNIKLSGETVGKDRHLIAICGDRNEPCPLNIDINIGAINDIRNILNGYESDLNEYKNKVIVDKNDLLFGYISSENAVEKFDELKNDIKSTTEIFEIFFDDLNNIINNPEKKNKLEKSKKDFYENVDALKSMIQEFKKSNSTQYIIDAIELYKNEILPKTKKIMKYSYAYNNVEYDDDDGKYYLIQKKNTIQEFEIDVGDNDHSVISMKLGMPKKIKKNPLIILENQERIPELKLKKKKKVKLIIKEDTPENIQNEMDSLDFL
jgi:hypothetical protein